MDKLYEIALGVLLCIALGFLVQQEISLREQLSAVNRSLDTEIQCRVGSTCAQKLSDEAIRGAGLVDAARRQAATEAQAAQLAHDQQAADALRQQQATAVQAQKEAQDWKVKYAKALQAPDCATWAKQVMACAVR